MEIMHTHVKWKALEHGISGDEISRKVGRDSERYTENLLCRQSFQSKRKIHLISFRFSIVSCELINSVLLYQKSYGFSLSIAPNLIGFLQCHTELCSQHDCFPFTSLIFWVTKFDLPCSSSLSRHYFFSYGEVGFQCWHLIPGHHWSPPIFSCFDLRGSIIDV